MTMTCFFFFLLFSFCYFHLFFPFLAFVTLTDGFNIDYGAFKMEAEFRFILGNIPLFQFLYFFPSVGGQAI